jgi:hypothetical protein
MQLRVLGKAENALKGQNTLAYFSKALIKEKTEIYIHTIVLEQSFLKYDLIKYLNIVRYNNFYWIIVIKYSR